MPIWPTLQPMGAMSLNLGDRTVVIAGSFGPLVQNLASALTENGADVALVVDDANMAQRFCQNLMDLREVSERYGRSVAIENSLKDEADAQEAFSRSAEVFGTTDIYIDTHLFNLELPLIEQDNLASAESAFSTAFQKSHVVSGAALNFIRNRSKSRLLYIAHELDLLNLSQLGSEKPKEFSEYINRLCLETAKEQITVNALAVGASDEYIMGRYGSKTNSIRDGLKILQETAPNARLVDYSDVSSIVSFMVSPLSTALNGQVVQLDHGLQQSF